MTLTEWMGIGSTLAFGVWTVVKFLQAQKVDARSAQSAIVTSDQAGFDQQVKWLNELVNQLQEENQKLLADASRRADLYAASIVEIARLRKKYAPNGENGDTPQPPNKEN